MKSFSCLPPLQCTHCPFCSLHVDHISISLRLAVTRKSQIPSHLQAFALFPTVSGMLLLGCCTFLLFWALAYTHPRGALGKNSTGSRPTFSVSLYHRTLFSYLIVCIFLKLFNVYYLPLPLECKLEAWMASFLFLGSPVPVT